MKLTVYGKWGDILLIPYLPPCAGTDTLKGQILLGNYKALNVPLEMPTTGKMAT
jgi:hypothetical protein